MSAQHTPGPWRFVEASQTIVSNQSHPVARLSEPFHRQCHGGRTGNDGPLIAATPELLADLRVAAAALRDYERQHRTKGTADSDAKAEVNAALAGRFERTITKATGSAA